MVNSLGRGCFSTALFWEGFAGICLFFGQFLVVFGRTCSEISVVERIFSWRLGLYAQSMSLFIDISSESKQTTSTTRLSIEDERPPSIDFNHSFMRDQARVDSIIENIRRYKTSWWFQTFKNT